MFGGWHRATWLLAACLTACGGNASETKPASGGSESDSDDSTSGPTTSTSTTATNTNPGTEPTTTGTDSDAQSDAESDGATSDTTTDTGVVDPGCDDGAVAPGEVCLEVVYSYPAQDRAGDVVVGDLDGDSHLDLLIGTPQNGQIAIAYGNGDGSFEPPMIMDSTANRAGAVQLADLDGDEDLDIAIGDTQNAQLVVFLVNAGTLGSPIPSPVFVGVTDFAFGHFNTDDALDVAVASGATSQVRIALGSQTGSYDFSAPQELTSLVTAVDVEAEDIDDDGDIDLVTANNGSDTVTVLRNNGTGLFNVREDLTVLDQPLSVSLADFDGDGGKDIVTANFNADRLTVHNSTPMGFDETTVQINVGADPAEVITPDIDGDGDFDILVVGRGSSDELKVFLGDGTGKFMQHPRTFVFDNDPTHLAVGDFNEDGALDVAVTAEGTDRLFILLSDP